MEQFHELERQLSELKQGTLSKPGFSPTEMKVLAAERDALKLERNTLTSERDRLKAGYKKLLEEKKLISAERDEAIAKQDQLKEQWGYAKGRAEELERRLAETLPPKPGTPGFSEKPPADIANLHQRIQSLVEERNNWLREYERCNDENERLRRAGTGVVK